MESVSITSAPQSGVQYNGFYRGRVLEHGKQGMCRIWIPEVYPPEWQDDPKLIPLAEQAQPLTAFGNQRKPEDAGGGPGGVSGGVYTYPAIDSCVWCFFIGGNIETPVYFAACSNLTMAAEDDWESIELSKTTKGFMFKFYLAPEDEEEGGEPDHVELNVFTKDAERAIKLTMASSDKDTEKLVKNQILIDKNGIELYTSETLKLTSLKGIELNGMSVSLNSKGKVDVKASGESISLMSPLITADCQYANTGEGHFLLKFWERFMGKIKPVEVRYPL